MSHLLSWAWGQRWGFIIGCIVSPIAIVLWQDIKDWWRGRQSIIGSKI